MDLKSKNQIIQDSKNYAYWLHYLLAFIKPLTDGEGRKVNVPCCFTFENCHLVHVAVCAPLLLHFKSSFPNNFSK